MFCCIVALAVPAKLIPVTLCEFPPLAELEVTEPDVEVLPIIFLLIIVVPAVAVLFIP